MKKLNAVKVLELLLKHKLENLWELTKIEDKTDFIQGQIIADVEVLEIIKEFWEDAEKNGLNFEIEEVFPI